LFFGSAPEIHFKTKNQANEMMAVPPAAVVVVDWWHFHPPMDRKLHQFPPQQPYST
jgi:hypothetical protein